MPKIKAPLLSLDAHGTIADQITFQNTGAGKISRRKPIPTDRRTIQQAYHRWDYSWYAYQWSLLSDAEKATYFTAGAASRIPAFAAYMKEMLTTLPDLAGRWHLDCHSPDEAFDSSKNAITGDIVKAVPTDGRIARALYFNGLNAYVDLAKPPSLNALTSALTIAMFINPVDIDGNNDYFYKVRWGGPANNGGYILRTIINKRITGIVLINGSKTIISPNNTLTYGWQHIAMTYDDPTLKIYHNAVEVGSVNHAGPIPDHDNGIAYIGSKSNYPEATIDEVNVFTHALTQPEIAILSDRRYPPQ